jgi:hypothetical protein
MEHAAEFRQKLEERGKMAIAYLAGNINANGSFCYSVRADSGRFSTRYNILRHAGALFEICEWARLDYGQIEFARVQGGYGFLLQHLQPWAEMACIVEDGEAKLGGAALTLLALCAYLDLTGDDRYFSEMKKLADFICWMQQPSGFFRSKYTYPEKKLDEFDSDYYSGQSLLALVRYYRIIQDKKYLECARRYAQMLSRSTINSLPEEKSVHTWPAKGLAALFLIEPDPIYMEKLGEIGFANIRSLYGRPEFQVTGEIGGEKFSSASMASLCEALVACLDIALFTDNAAQAKVLTKGIDAALHFCMRHQIIEDRLFGEVNLNGGLIHSYADFRVRIDYAQHFIGALSGVLQLCAPDAVPTTTQKV